MENKWDYGTYLSSIHPFIHRLRPSETFIPGQGFKGLEKAGIRSITRCTCHGLHYPISLMCVFGSQTLHGEEKNGTSKEESAYQRKRRRSAGRRCTSCPSTVRHVSSPTPPSSAVILRVQEIPLPTVATTTAVVSMAVAGGSFP